MNIPRHVAIILDGNGRWAKAKGMPRNYGHAQGSKNVERICEEAWRMEDGHQVPDSLCIFYGKLEPSKVRGGCSDEAASDLYENMLENGGKK